jgi:neprilysin
VNDENVLKKYTENILEKLDECVNPCDDFFNFTCKKFMNETSIPDDEVTVSSFSETSTFREMKRFYGMCMNTKRVEKLGLNHLRKIFNELGGLPVLNKEPWKGKSPGWKKFIIEAAKRGLLVDKMFSCIVWVIISYLILF